MKATRTASGPSVDAAIDATQDARADLDVRACYRRLIAAGLSEPGAGNVTAYAVGLRPMTVAWTVRQIDVLLFLRDLVRRGLIDP